MIIPASAPIAAEAMIARKIIVISESNVLINAFISKIIQPDIKAAIEPTDKSIPPVVITKVAPIATMPINELRAIGISLTNGTVESPKQQALKIYPSKSLRPAPRDRISRFGSPVIIYPG